MPPEVMRVSSSICYTMFQSYEFKVHLGFAYLANIDYLYRFMPSTSDGGKCLVLLGV